MAAAVRRGDPVADRTLRAAGAAVGRVLGTASLILDPADIVIGGEITRVAPAVLEEAAAAIAAEHFPGGSRPVVRRAELSDDDGALGALAALFHSSPLLAAYPERPRRPPPPPRRSSAHGRQRTEEWLMAVLSDQSGQGSRAGRDGSGAPTGKGRSGTTAGSAGGAAGARRRGISLLLNAVSVGFGIALWWALAAAGLTLPTPGEVVSKAGTLLSDGTLQEDILASMGRVLAGFALGTGLAIPVGFLMGWYGFVRGLVEPWVQFFRTIPPLAIIPLAIVLMGIGETPKIFVIFLAAFLVCVISTFQGVVDIDRTLINAARVLGAKDLGIFLRVVVPASTPFILVGMRVGLGSAWATLVAAELIAAQEGLGYRMQNAQLYYDLPTIFVGLITIGILGLLMDRVLLLAERKLTGWQERR
ncbi:ROK family protein [Actinomadura sp. CNU-125]|uniref:ROK family protein n=1 Tax=Actinomadura sp. CNU-125 TaxID=1904961 RepID=UPI0021CCDA90|nr:ROK family protein [Actinomadura sp. CNU-125]